MQGEGVRQNRAIRAVDGLQARGKNDTTNLSCGVKKRAYGPFKRVFGAFEVMNILCLQGYQHTMFTTHIGSPDVATPDPIGEGAEK